MGTCCGVLSVVCIMSAVDGDDRGQDGGVSLVMCPRPPVPWPWAGMVTALHALIVPSVHSVSYSSNTSRDG